MRVPIGGGDPETVDAGSAEGAPAEPVYVAGCAYGAWSGSGRFVRDCPGEADDVVQDVPGIEPTSVLRFRVNRDVVVLNDVFGGAAWMASDSMQRVDNWQDITPPEGEGDDEEETTEETVQTTLPERTDQNTPPVAQDDEYGVRPGRTTVLPVLDNDTDADGDVLVAAASSTPGFGSVEPINNGAALQFTTPEDATGSTSFRYTVDDGSLLNQLHHLIGPCIVLALVSTAVWSRYMRSSMLDVINQDYIRTARAKGVPERQILLRHALRNALLPMITITGLQIPTLLSGALVTETVFTWPGMGRLFLDSISYRDYPVVMGILMFSAVLVLLGSLIADLLYGVADPRISGSH